MTLTLDQPEAILADIGILGRERYESFFCQPDREPMIVRRIDFRISHLPRVPLQTVLADHYWPPLTRLDILGDKQNPVSEDSGPHIQHHFITAKFWLVENQPRLGVGRHAGIGKPSDHLVPKVRA